MQSSDYLVGMTIRQKDINRGKTEKLRKNVTCNLCCFERANLLLINKVFDDTFCLMKQLDFYGSAWLLCVM